MQYWINHKGEQFGPVELDGLKEMALTSEAYVWHEGLDGWKKITQLPELQGYYVIVGQESADSASQEAADMAGESPADTADSEPVAVNIPPIPDVAPGMWGQPQQGFQPPQYAQPQPADEPTCPPTNLVWAIISMVLCCVPTGIVAIVYALKVSNKYRIGDIKGAERASETGAWWCIATIILGIIFQPLTMLLMMSLGAN